MIRNLSLRPLEFGSGRLPARRLQTPKSRTGACRAPPVIHRHESLRPGTKPRNTNPSQYILETVFQDAFSSFTHRNFFCSADVYSFSHSAPTSSVHALKILGSI